jgi:hypothetical protein
MGHNFQNLAISSNTMRIMHQAKGENELQGRNFQDPAL